jgi:glutamyl-tRNA synthetase
MGYLPEALCNYLARLGWAHGDDEMFSMGQLAEWFSLEAVNKSAARFDFAKLASLNAQNIRAAAPGRLCEVMADTAREIGNLTDAEGLSRHRDTVLAAIPELQPRAQTVLELIEGAGFIHAIRPIILDAAAASLLEGAGRDMLAAFLPGLEGLKQWSHEALDEAAREFAEAQGVKLGKLAQPLRAALTGRVVSPGIFEVMVLIGRDETLGRIGDVLAA